jgi:hypothetical protein
MTGYKTRKKRLRGIETGGRPLPSQPAAVPLSHLVRGAGSGACANPLPGEGFGKERRVYDVWTQPTVKDVYAQLKVAETMLSRCTDPALAIVKRKMYDLEDTMWQFLGG